jgi:hypothetical protein
MLKSIGRALIASIPGALLVAMIADIAERWGQGDPADFVFLVGHFLLVTVFLFIPVLFLIELFLIPWPRLNRMRLLSCLLGSPVFGTLAFYVLSSGDLQRKPHEETGMPFSLLISFFISGLALYSLGVETTRDARKRVWLALCFIVPVIAVSAFVYTRWFAPPILYRGPGGGPFGD